jgi:DNA-binding CsgD family transcriptional regulator
LAESGFIFQFQPGYVDRSRIGNGEAPTLPPKWDSLSEREKDVIILFVLHGLSQKEIAFRLGITTSTVKFHLYVAKRILRISDTSSSVRLGLWVGLHIGQIDPRFELSGG